MIDIEQVEKRIKMLGIKKIHLANKIDCSPTELSYFLKGKRELRVESLTKLINYLGL